MEYMVNFLDKKGDRESCCVFCTTESEDFFDKLEETLYAMDEITPVHRHWKRDLRKNRRCLFTYHNVEYAVVEWREGDDRGITVQDV